MRAQGRPDEDGHGIRVLAGRYSDAYLQRASWQPGYTIVVWRGRHVAEPTELDEEEAGGYWREVLRVASALERHYRPVKLNLPDAGEHGAAPAHAPAAPVRGGPGSGAAVAVPGGGAAHGSRGPAPQGRAGPAGPGLTLPSYGSATADAMLRWRRANRPGW